MHPSRAAAGRAWLARLALAVAALSAAGCGSSGPQMAPVSGTVQYQGQPLKAGTVTFAPTDGERPSATGTIQPDGTYTLQTTEPGDGAVVGDYRVAITDVDSNSYVTELPGMPPSVPKSAIPQKYTDPNTSGLTATVESGANTKDFELQ